MLHWKCSAALIILLLAACTPPPPGPDDAGGEITFGLGPFDLVDPAAGLADLSGYRATLTISFDGMRDGLAEQWTRSYEVLARQEDPPARQVMIRSSGLEAGGLSFEVWLAEIGGVHYERLEDGSCAASLAAKGGSFAKMWEPARFLSGLIGAEEAGTEMVSGISANHYTFDENAFGEAGIAETTGAVWVAPEGYVVRYTSSTQGGADYFGEGIEGTIIWEYELSDIGQPAAIALPEDCPAGMVDAPVMPDAQDVRQLPSVTTFSTTSDVAAVMAFYREQLPEMGWQVSGEPVVADTFAVVTFTQGDQQLSVIATTGEGGTTVQLVLGKVQAAPSD